MSDYGRSDLGYEPMGPPRSSGSTGGETGYYRSSVGYQGPSAKGSYLILSILGIIILIASVIILILAALRKFPTVTLSGTVVQTTGTNGSTTNVDWPLILVCVFIGIPTGIGFMVAAQRLKF